jgi:hypothetical protein
MCITCFLLVRVALCPFKWIVCATYVCRRVCIQAHNELEFNQSDSAQPRIMHGRGTAWWLICIVLFLF